MLDWVENGLLASKGLSRENTLPEIMCDIIFEKMKGHGGTEQALMQKQPSKEFFLKRCYEKFLEIHKKTSVPKKRDPTAGVSLWILRNL